MRKHLDHRVVASAGPRQHRVLVESCPGHLHHQSELVRHLVPPGQRPLWAGAVAVAVCPGHQAVAVHGQRRRAALCRLFHAQAIMNSIAGGTPTVTATNTSVVPTVTSTSTPVAGLYQNPSLPARLPANVSLPGRVNARYVSGDTARRPSPLVPCRARTANLCGMALPVSSRTLPRPNRA